MVHLDAAFSSRNKDIQESPAAAQISDKSRKIALITLVALGIFAILGAIAFGIAAAVTGIHFLWIGTVVCAIAAIGCFGSLLCVAKNPRQRNWTFEHPEYIPTAPVFLGGRYRRGTQTRNLPSRFPMSNQVSNRR